MKVILQSDVKGTGKKGQLVDVSDGYARNFLLPRKLALEANAANVNVMKTQDAAKAHKLELERAAAQELKEKVDGKTLTIDAKGGKSGKLFGAVTGKEVSEKLKAVYGVEIDKRKIGCGDIKLYGDYQAEIKIYPEITAKITIKVVEEHA